MSYNQLQDLDHDSAMNVEHNSGNMMEQIGKMHMNYSQPSYVEIPEIQGPLYHYGTINSKNPQPIPPRPDQTTPCTDTSKWIMMAGAATIVVLVILLYKKSSRNSTIKDGAMYYEPK